MADEASTTSCCASRRSSALTQVCIFYATVHLGWWGGYFVNTRVAPYFLEALALLGIVAAPASQLRLACMMAFVLWLLCQTKAMWAAFTLIFFMLSASLCCCASVALLTCTMTPSLIRLCTHRCPPARPPPLPPHHSVRWRGLQAHCHRLNGRRDTPCSSNMNMGKRVHHMNDEDCLPSSRMAVMTIHTVVGRCSVELSDSFAGAYVGC